MKTKHLLLKKSIAILSLMMTALVMITGCKKDEPDPEENNNKQYVLIIENGAQTIHPDESIAYSAILVDKNGSVTQASDVSWSVSQSSVATISSSGQLSVAGTGDVTVSASVSVDGITYTASVPLGIYAPSVFQVAPSAIIYEAGESLQLETVHLSTSGAVTPTCTFSSSDGNVATVNGSGLVSFIGTGECIITVTATSIDGNPVVYVPVLVIGEPEIVLPVTRIDVNPPAKDLFKNETQQLTAKAYKSDGSEATGTIFTWSSLNPEVATVNSSGLVTPVRTGSTYIQATASGIIGQAEIIVNPDTLVVVEPFYVSLSAGQSRQFTASAYHVTRTSATPYSGVTFDWMIPTYGMSMFDIATVNSSGLVTVKDDAMAGMMTFVVASDHNNPYVGGAGSIVVGLAGDCDCGNGNPAVDHITVSNSQPVTMSLMSGGQVQLNVTAYDVSDNVVADPQLVFCSGNELVVTVSSEGELIPVGEGTTTVKICSGTYAETTVNITVTMM